MIKVVRNAEGFAVAYGPNDNSYQPSLKEGEVISIEGEPPINLLPLTKEQKIQSALDAASVDLPSKITRFDVWNCIIATEGACQAIATATGITFEQAKANARARGIYYRKCKDLETIINLIEMEE